LLLALILLFGLGSTLALQADRAKPNKERIGDLIARLGSRSFAQRQQASKNLDAIGVPALEALRKATTSPDMEISRRARDLVDRIEKRAEAALLLAPTRVHLVCKDLPVADAVAQLAKQSKFDIKIHPNAKVKLAKRTITLNTGKVTFWEAFDQLCEKAGLLETSAPVGATVPAWTNPGIQPPILPPPVAPVPIVVPPIKLKKIAPPAIRIPIKKPLRKQAAVPRKAMAAQVAAAVKGQVQVLKKQVKPIQIGVAVKQVQVQVPPPKAILPVFPVKEAEILYPPQGPSGQIFLTEGKSLAVPTRYCGALRVRLITKITKTPNGKPLLSADLEVTAEPKLQNWSLIGGARINQATDDSGQSLALELQRTPIERDVILRKGMAPAIWMQQDFNVYNSNPGSGSQQMVPVQFKLGAKQAKLLKTLTGNLTSEIVAPPEPLLTMDKILKAAGKTVKGPRGGSLKVVRVDKNKNGDYEVAFKLEKPAGVSEGGYALDPWGGIRFGGVGGPVNMRIQINNVNGNVVIIQQVAGNMGVGPNTGGASGGMSLVDARGNHFVLVNTSGKVTGDSLDMTLTFRPGKGKFGPPEKLIYTASRKVSVDVPFTYKDVKLP
jgi:hypothetical protein